MIDPDDPFSVSPTDMHLLVGAITQTIDDDPVLAGARLKLLSRCGRHFGFSMIRDAVKNIVEAWRALDWFNVILPGGGWKVWNEEYVVSLVISGNSSLLESIRIDRIDLISLFEPVQNLHALAKEQREAVQEFYLYMVSSGNASLLDAIRIDRIDLKGLFKPDQNLHTLSQEQRDAVQKFYRSMVSWGNASLLDAIRIDRIDLESPSKPVQNLHTLAQEQRDAMQKSFHENERRVVEVEQVPEFDETLFRQRFTGALANEDRINTQGDRRRDTHTDGAIKTSNLWLGPLFDLSEGRAMAISGSTTLNIRRIKSKWGPLFDGNEV